MASGQYRAVRRLRKASTPCEIKIILDPTKCRLDPDNPVKNAIDYLRRLELIENDTGKHVRRIVVEWGEAPPAAASC
jgi:Holliday junction resolvase RusA-like endonuclease